MARVRDRVEEAEAPTLGERVYRGVFGRPRDIRDRSIFHQLALVPFLAWVGLGADGLSSSSYGPMEAFLTLGEHPYLAILLALATALTVLVISAAYRHIIEAFPHGGGGYLVASKLLGRPVGVVSGSALLVDYVLTITVSVAAAGDALFSFLPPEWHAFKLASEGVVIAVLTIANIRGVKEAVIPLVPVFVLFLITHVYLIVAGTVEHAADVPATLAGIGSGFREGARTLGWAGMLALLARAYSLGGGTYTGIEAVSNGLPIMREPRVHTGRRTMLYMALSLAFTASGLLLCYLLVGVRFEEGKTLNAVLAKRVLGDSALAQVVVIATLVSEGALLVVAAQAGFIDGPRVLANMAGDGWAPRRFASLSERLTARNGILLMGGASLAALVYTRGEVSALVVMYSINVFLTFSLSMAGMLRMNLKQRRWRHVPLFTVGFLLCVTILFVTAYEKFLEGGWLTLVVTTGFAAMCFAIHRHYRNVGQRLAKLDRLLDLVPPARGGASPRIDHHRPTAAFLVGGFNGVGIETLNQVLKQFQGHYRNLVFISVGAVDSGAFRGADEMEALRAETEKAVNRYVDLAHRLGYPAAARYGVGTDPVSELARLCVNVSRNFNDVTFFGGKLVFPHERWYHRILHNHTTLALQQRLLETGLTVVVMPKRVG